MTTEIQTPLLQVQHDWEVSVRKDFDPFWVSYKDGRGGKSEGRVIVKKHGADVVLEGEDGFRAALSQSASQCLMLTAPDGFQSQIYCPTQIYPALHNKKAVYSIALSPEGDLAVSGGPDGGLKIWDPQDGSIRRDLIGHVGDVNCVRFFPSGEVVLSGSADRILRIWSATEGYSAAELKGHALGVLDCAIIDRGRNVLSCSRDGTAKLWDVPSQAAIFSFPLVPDAIGFTAPAANAICLALNEAGGKGASVDARDVGTEGKLLLVAGENKVTKCFDLRTRYTVMTLQDVAPVNCLLSANGHEVSAGTDDGSVSRWDLRHAAVAQTRVRRTKAPIRSLAHTSPHTDLVAAADGVVYEWNESTSKPQADLSGSDSDMIYNVVTRSGRVYTTCRDGAVRQYRIPSQLQ